MDRSGRSPGSGAASGTPSVRITSAHTSHSERVRGRQTRYLISMGVRTACFILAVMTDGALRWAFIVAAVVLPYFAVVVANASGEVDDGGPAPFVDDSRPMLEAGPAGRAETGEQTTEQAGEQGHAERPGR
jgi:hypothetical protein